jgi:hypothetical protein
VNARRSSEDLVAELSGALAPVRPIPALRAQALAVAGVWAATGAALLAFAGARPVAVLARGALSAAIAADLAMIGAAAVTIGLAARVPGRERTVRAAYAALAAGAALGIALLVPLLGTQPGPGVIAHGRRCMDRSFLLALPTAALAAALAVRGAPWHAWASAAGVTLGASALGGLLVHLTCPSPDPWHWLVAHALVPALGGGALGLAAGWLVNRRASRDRPRAT